MRRSVVVLALLLTACGQAAEKSAATAPEPLTLTCEAFAGVSGESLAARFGAENLVEQTLPGPEGESYQATVLFPNDSARRAEIVWVDPTARTRIAAISVGEGSNWEGPLGARVSAPLSEIAAANGKPFTLWGFGWDYGGWVSDWNGGAFAPTNACMTRVRFAAQAANHSAQGDSAFASNSAEIAGADARVSELGLVYIQAE